MFVHGHTAGGETPEYRAWIEIKTRCNNPKSNRFRYYGGRGITMCERWQNSFPAFLADMGRKPAAMYSVDRINNDGNYEPSNCRWATPSEQALNRRPRQRSTNRRPRNTGDIALSKQVIGFRASEEVVERVRQLAAAERRPLSQYISILIEDALEKRKPEQQRA